MKKSIISALLMCSFAGVVLAAGPGSKGADAERAKYIAQISKNFGSQIEAMYKMPKGEWLEQMLETLSDADLANLKNAAEAKTLGEMTNRLFGNISQKSLGQRNRLTGQSLNPRGDLVFTPLPPCRIVDTRVRGGNLLPNETRGFLAWSSTGFQGQGGAAINCGIPAGAAALAMNVVADTKAKVGYLSVFPTGTIRTGSSVNFIGVPVANELNVRLCDSGCETQFSVYASAGTRMVVDVYGYYMEPAAKPLECTTVKDVTADNGVYAASCPAGYTPTSASCASLNLDGPAFGTKPIKDATGTIIGYQCRPNPTAWNSLAGCTLFIFNCKGLGGGLDNTALETTCCRVPGR
ncbi:hypothetical protein [Luteimonas panaciterrae]|uniref:hypothetical protein n=1 Tax=Luteimonas panaciterrae TaxID=363885 RepID=UPI001CFA6F58|nr:hypothetical protein [Luteimonas panaciterrae]